MSGYACSSPLYEFEGWLFEWHHYCGPWPLRKDLELRARAGRKFWAMYDRFRALPEAEREQHRVGGERWVGSVVEAEVSDETF